ncbi:MAG: hypothetical protein US13_C0001G0084 [candidate division TM6 bacterium GW2011_GWE2_36_25]|nr:MAG: hypothetical protein US03_C0001G0120 [candidate division TM6 bacterium GW2011_GWF2_36_131]KKQ03744.1 MAG: hypothetical protein US13_C0001G0084 [candidate division TM6 bacterium GW2011_GWE2_36_25]KKQ19888.1 MAG: hypothetical protein US32_C0003G0005 [candidate division TM6 bacterium GW2011_GWA2_36_9]
MEDAKDWSDMMFYRDIIDGNEKIMEEQHRSSWTRCDREILCLSGLALNLVALKLDGPLQIFCTVPGSALATSGINGSRSSLAIDALRKVQNWFCCMRLKRLEECKYD